MTDKPHNLPEPIENRLSPQGRARARAIHDDLLAHIDRRRNRRHALHISSGLAALVALFGVVTSSRTPISPTNPSPIASAHDTSPTTSPIPTPPQTTRRAFAILASDPSALSRFSISTTTPTLVRNLTDDQLLASFRAQGLSIALIRINGHTHLAAN